MKYLDEFRDPRLGKAIIREIYSSISQSWKIMEICGGQTHSIIKYGLDQLLPKNLELVHGPGCPVCVTPLEKIDRAIAIAGQDDVIFASFGDMLRVPGSQKDLFMVKSEGGDIRVVYSPLDAIKIARQNPEKKVVFFAIGFETTTPTAAMAVLQAKKLGIKNFSIIGSHSVVPPAIRALQASPENSVQGLLAAGHVCTVTGLEEYEALAKDFGIPIVATGFEPLDILQGILMLVRQLEEGRTDVENQYGRSVRYEGNIEARRVVEEVFKVTDRKWRGIGNISGSGMELKPEFDEFNAEKIFNFKLEEVAEPDRCISGKILQGLSKPTDCKAYGIDCTPERPLGATMVSTEGTCHAYYINRRNLGME